MGLSREEEAQGALHPVPPVGEDPGPGLGRLPEEGLPPRGLGLKGGGAEAEAGLQGLAFL